MLKRMTFAPSPEGEAFVVVNPFWLFWSPLRPDALGPQRKSDEAAGYDLYTPDPVILKSKSLTKIPLGIATAWAPGWGAMIYDRSGIGLKEVIRHCGLLDSDYRGEWVIALYNHSDVDISFDASDRIAQVAFSPVGQAEPVMTNRLPESVRGEGGFGSTGK
jgi:dUTP pyrophosphatase